MPSKNPSILVGAVVYTLASLVVGFLSMSGGQSAQYLVGALCCLAALAGPFAAVWHYSSTQDTAVPVGAGTGMGAAAVVLGGLMGYAITRLLQVGGVFPSEAEALERSRDEMISQGMEPEAVDQVLAMTQMFQGVAGFLGTLVVAAVVGALGGAIAASVFKRGQADYEV